MINFRTGTSGMQFLKTNGTQKVENDNQAKSPNVDELCDQFKQGQLSLSQFKEKLAQLGATDIIDMIKGSNQANGKSVRVTFKLDGKSYSITSYNVPEINMPCTNEDSNKTGNSTNLDFDIDEFLKRREEEIEKRLKERLQRNLELKDYEPQNGQPMILTKGHNTANGISVDEVRVYNPETGNWKIDPNHPLINPNFE